ncbi:MBL fold metallo-hydrolase [Candidatus Riflebacteria bacterium]
MNGTITFLVDNKAKEPYIAEHGLSILLEIKGKRLLFDTGQGKALFHNAKKLGISLSGLNALILSHGHYDHGGNLAKIFSLNPSLPFFAHPNCLRPRWSLHPGKESKSVALSKKDRAAIMNLSPTQLHWCHNPIEIMTEVWISGAIPRKNSFEDVGGPFYQDKMGNKPDLLPDDIALWIGGESGLTVIFGCGHSGVKNTIEHIVSLYDVIQINTLIGGFHLVHAKNKRLTKTVSFINETGVKRVFPAHCTGETAVTILHEQLNAEVQPGKVGLQIRI